MTVCIKKSLMKNPLLIVCLCLSCYSLFAQWERMPGGGFDIGVGPEGTTWVIGAGQSIHRWNRTTWQRMPGLGVRIDVDPQGDAWVVNQAGNIFRWNGRDWGAIAGAATDIGIGAGGRIWAIGRTAATGGYNILRWTGTSWQNMPGAAVRIDADPAGNAWVVNSAGNVFLWNSIGWTELPGRGRDISVGADGSVWLLGWNNVGGGYPVFRWNGRDWTPVEGGLVNISAGPKGVVWGTNNGNDIWRQGGERVMTRFIPSTRGFKFENNFVTNFAGIDFYGLCGGMAYAAIDYFHSGRSIPDLTTPPPVGTALRQYIYDRQNNSVSENLDKWAELTVNPFGARNQEFYNWGLQGFNGGRLQELRTEIDAGRPVPLGLYKGGNGGFNTHHQVIAIGYALGRYTGDLGANKEDLRIYVCDSNFPNQTMTLRPNVGNLTYYYEEEPTCSWFTYFVDRKYRQAIPPRL